MPLLLILILTVVNKFILLCFQFISLFCTVTLAAVPQNDRMTTLIQQVNAAQHSAIQNKEERVLIGRASWKISCRIQANDNLHFCMMRKNHITVMRLNDDYNISVGHSHAKNTLSFLKVDHHLAVSAREGLFRDANDLVIQFKQGNLLRIGYQLKGADTVQYSELSLIGFNDAFEDMQAQFKQNR